MSYLLRGLTYSLNIVENELANIVATQGSNAISFAALVKENEEILDAMKVSLRINTLSICFLS